MYKCGIGTVPGSQILSQYHLVKKIFKTREENFYNMVYIFVRLRHSLHLLQGRCSAGLTLFEGLYITIIISRTIFM